ncbi:cytochrome P450 [Zychaea mexicana]|uniref:cytochrome P450 n=1 Tax=Zychaea mexicana TaxID=64656 RepID=UPI0022FEFB2C|nr:cytochrome P450 [Zychaea mexicana]KAI9493584.1 cytochrome P450 [Zychaea mexicana]
MLPIFENAQQLFQTAEARLGDRVTLPFGGINTSLKNALIGAGVTGFISYAVSKYIVYYLYLHPLSKIPGPPVDWIPLMGNIREIFREEAGVPHKKWAEQYGGIVCYHGPWNRPRIMVTDPDMLKQILMTQVYDFTKTPEGSEFLGRILGHGLLVSEGDLHRRHRKMLNPAFSLQAIRELTPILFVPPVQLYEKWMDEIKAKQTNLDDAVEIVVSHGLSLVTLDEIGLGGFGQEFNAVRYDGTDKVNKLSWAYQTIFDPSQVSLMQALAQFFPMLRHLPTQRKQQVDKALRLLDEESKIVVQRGIDRVESANNAKTSYNDLLTLMIRNADEDESGQGFTAEELRNQCLTFLAAGHETTAVSLSWCLWLLAQHQDIQDELRAEVTPVFEKINMDDPVFHEDPFRVGFDSANIPSFDTINNLHHLNNVCRETSRLIPVVPLTTRYASKDAVLKNHFIPKGTSVFLPIVVNHHSKALWGEDAESFRPSRWDEQKASKVGPYEYYPFLAGARQCIGYRFALIELKIILAVLVMKFQFFEKPGFVIKKKQQITLRPAPNMTLLVKPVPQKAQ